MTSFATTLPAWAPALGLGVGLAGLYLLLCFALRRLASRPADGDEVIEAVTEDGWTLSLHRFGPAEGLEPRPVPVILAHGLMMNRSSWALSAPHSLPKALAARGHEVFVAEYRGDRSSRRPPGSPASTKWNVTQDDYAFRDLPALIEAVRQKCGVPKVHWIGHSMGGILLYRYVHRFGDGALDRAVTLGSPVDFGSPPRIMLLLEGVAVRVLRLSKAVRVRAGALLILPYLALRPQAARFFGALATNLSRREILTLVTTALEDVSIDVLSWFLDRGRDRKPLFDEEEGLGFFRRPLLVLAGTEDRIAPPRSVRPAFDGVASAEKAWYLLGDPESTPGAPALSHCDLITGAPSIEHVFPLIDRWLEPPPDA